MRLTLGAATVSGNRATTSSMNPRRQGAVAPACRLSGQLSNLCKMNDVAVGLPCGWPRRGAGPGQGLALVPLLSST